MRIDLKQDCRLPMACTVYHWVNSHLDLSVAWTSGRLRSLSLCCCEAACEYFPIMADIIALFCCRRMDEPCSVDAKSPPAPELKFAEPNKFVGTDFLGAYANIASTQ